MMTLPRLSKYNPMDFKKFSRLVNSPRNISGIYNYCDRWCERCPVTLRLLFSFDGKQSQQQKIHDDLPKPAHQI